MIPPSLLIHLEIILFTVLTNGQNNPFFTCQRVENMETYDIVLNQSNEIVIANCTNLTTIGAIIDQIFHTRQGTALTIQHDSSILTLAQLKNTSTLDLSRNNLTEVNLENFPHLEHLNLTTNKIRSFMAIKLRKNITLVSLDVSRNRLLKFEHHLIPKTRKLYLRSNNIFELDDNVTLPNTLIELDLTRNEIENLKTVKFRSPNLRVLNLSINLINAFSSATIEHLPQLEILILKCNKIFEIENGSFSKNAKLIELNLRDNNLSTLKKAIFEDLINLQILDISKNHLLQLRPDVLQNLNNLAEFSVSENRKLCDRDCKRNLEFLFVLGGRLKKLKMARLHLRQFPVTLTTSIRHLDLSKNKLKAVQLGNLENFPYLETLMLTDNQIESVESQVFSSLEFLVVLHLNQNQLKRIPATLPSSLVELRLDYNNVTRIEKTNFQGLVNLKLLKLNSNSIKSIESGCLWSLKNLETLDLSNNPILKLSTDSWEGLTSLRILLATDLTTVHINATDVRYFPISEMRSVLTLNLSRSPDLSRAFVSDLPLLATAKQLETLDVSYTNLTSIPNHLHNYLPRLKLLNLRGNTLNCTNNWLSSREFDFRELFVNRTNSGLSVRLVTTPYRFEMPPNECVYSGFGSWKVSGETFWKSANKTRNYTVFHAEVISISEPSDYTNSTRVADYAHNSTLISPSNQTDNGIKGQRSYDGKLSRKKQTRSLHIAQFANQNASQTNRATFPTDFPTIEIKLLTTTGTATSTLHPTLNVTFANATSDNTSIPETTTTTNPQNDSFTSEPISLNVSLRNNARKNSALISSNESLSNASLRANESNFYASTSSQPSPKGHYESLVWNQTDDYASFFDWFPGQNDSIATDLSERAMKAQDKTVPYTHPGIVIFSALSCFLVVIFASVIAPPYVQKYRWRRQRYKMSQFDNECQRSIEISSISAFVETEIPLE